MTRRASWISALALAGLVLAGCGGGSDTSTSDSKDSTDTVAAAVAMSKENFGDRVGEATKKAGSAHVTMSVALGNHEMKSESDLVWTEAGESASRTITTMGGAMGMDMETIQVGEVAYIKMGEMTGGKFFKVDPSDPDSPFADLYAESAGTSDVGGQLEMFDEGVVDVELIGDGGEIDGVKTTQYEVKVDIKRAMDSLDVDIPENESAEIPDTFVYTVFVGDDDLIRRMSTDLLGTTMTMNFSAWGQKVNVTAPAADQVTENFEIPGLDPEMLEGLAG